MISLPISIKKNFFFYYTHFFPFISFFHLASMRSRALTERKLSGDTKYCSFDLVRVWTAFVVSCARDFLSLRHPCCAYSLCVDKTHDALKHCNIFSTVVHFLSFIRLVDCFIWNHKKNHVPLKRCAFLLAKYKIADLFHSMKWRKKMCEQFSFFVRIKFMIEETFLVGKSKLEKRNQTNYYAIL